MISGPIGRCGGQVGADITLGLLPHRRHRLDPDLALLRGSAASVRTTPPASMMFCLFY